MNTWTNYTTEAQTNRTEDATKTWNDVVHAYATYRTDEWISMGKTWGPWADFQVDFFDAITVADTCDQTAATTCVDTYLQNKFMGNDDPTTMQTCVAAAGCTTNWDSMTSTEQEALATKFNTSVDTIGQAYQTISDQFADDLQTAVEDHDARQLAMQTEFVETVKDVAVSMGCDETEITNCVSDNSWWTPYSQYYTQSEMDVMSNEMMFNCVATHFTASHCNNWTDIVTVTEPVNTMARIEKQYGDLHSLTDSDLKSIALSMKMMRLTNKH